jgi:hypothetical protein
MKSVLSRVRRFLFWTLLLLLGAYIGWGRVEAWRLSRAVDAIQARGEPVDYGYWYAKQVTAEQKEAASLYARAAQYATEAESGQQYRASQIDVDLPSGPVLTFADIAASYRADAPAMQLLDRATPMDFTEFGEESRELYDNQIPLQVLGAQACLRADLIAARNGDGDGGAAALVPCLRLQRTFLRSYGAAAAARLLGSFRILLRHTSPSDSALAKLQESLAPWPDSEAMERALFQERVRFLSYADDPRRSFGEAVVANVTQPFQASLTRRRLAAYDEALRVARLPPNERQEALAATRRVAAATKRGPRALFLGAFFDSPEIYFGLGLNTGAAERAARRVIAALLAVERYRRAHSGAPPVSLATLVPEWLTSVPEDPYVPGQAIVYRRDPAGYVIYSVDANRRDDEGAFYGHGSAVAKHVGPQSPRDLGIRVPLKPIQ